MEENYKMTKKQKETLSDIFIIAMLALWIITVSVMIVMSVYATIVNADTSIWSELATLVTFPLTAGGAVWVFKQQGIKVEEG